VIGAVIVNEGSASITGIDVTKRAKTGTLRVGNNPDAAAFTPNGKYLDVLDSGATSTPGSHAIPADTASDDGEWEGLPEDIWLELYYGAVGFRSRP
jgi:DNA-binding beta-propeller fold protein YncE